MKTLVILGATLMLSTLAPAGQALAGGPTCGKGYCRSSDGGCQPCGSRFESKRQTNALQSLLAKARIPANKSYARN